MMPRALLRRMGALLDEHAAVCADCLLVVDGRSSERIRCVSCGRTLWTA